MTQKIQIGQARAVLMPKGMQWFGMQQAIEYIPAERADLEKEAEQVRKEVYGDPPFGAPSNLRIRIPHFSAPADGLTGGKRRVGEVALAHGGLLVLSPVEEFSRSKLEEIAYVMKQGKDSNGRPARFAVLLGVQPETLTLPTGRARVEKALALFGTTLSEQNNSNGMMTMRGLIRRLEESDRGTKAALTRLTRENEKYDKEQVFVAQSVLDMLVQIVKRSKTSEYNKLQFSDMDAQKQYDAGWKHVRKAVSSFKEAVTNEELDRGGIDDGMFALRDAVMAFQKVSLLLLRDLSVDSPRNLIKGIIDEIQSAREMFKITSGF